MHKITSFFLGIILLAVTLSAVFVVVLTYQANEQTSIKTYIFQTGNRPDTRVGPLQNINDMKPEGLRNKLIQKYVAEYFKVIPGTVRPEQRNTVAQMSTGKVYNQWSDNEAKNIEALAKEKMFRNVWVNTANIQPIKNSDWFAVPYLTRTWTQSNNMNADIINEPGIINLKIRFEPGIRPNINVRKYLEKGGDPAGLFKFEVTEVAM